MKNLESIVDNREPNTGASLPKDDLMPLNTAGLYPELENKS